MERKQNTLPTVIAQLHRLPKLVAISRVGFGIPVLIEASGLPTIFVVFLPVSNSSESTSYTFVNKYIILHRLEGKCGA